MAFEPIKRVFKEVVGLRQVEERIDETLKQHDTISGDFRDMRQRLESLKRLVARIKHGERPDEL